MLLKMNYKNVKFSRISTNCVRNIRNFFTVSLFLKKEVDTSFSKLSNYGKVFSNMDGIIKVRNMPTAKMGELVTFVETKDKGLILSIEHDSVNVVVLGSEIKILPGHLVERTNRLVSVIVSRALKGHVVNSLGKVIDYSDLDLNDLLKVPSLETFDIEATDEELEHFPEGSMYFDSFYKNVEAPAPSIMNRIKITEPLYTGTTIIDAAIPIGRGQRELIIGDRQIGKTTIGVDTILNQSMLLKHYGYFGDSSVVSVYVSIGQKMSSVVKIFNDLNFVDAMDSTIIVASSAADAASLQFLAPYTGCTYGEFFRDSGFHSVVIYDDLSKHAVAYRQMTLLLRRPSGREAYPGDIFYVHSRLLERAAATRIGTLTALPIIETQAGDVSAYIPTNIISITDGQIFLENELFYKGIRPAVNVALSVSRIGSSAQNSALKRVSATLKLDLVQYREVETFAMFGSDLDEATKKTLHRGLRLIEILKQDSSSPLHPLGQAVLIYSGVNGLLDLLSLPQVAVFKEKIINASLTGDFPEETFDEIAYGSFSDNLQLNLYLENMISTL
jgi:F-type H+-transporting ATPase subunit alpha